MGDAPGVWNFFVSCRVCWRLPISGLHWKNGKRYNSTCLLKILQKMRLEESGSMLFSKGSWKLYWLVSNHSLRLVSASPFSWSHGMSAVELTQAVWQSWKHFPAHTTSITAIYWSQYFCRFSTVWKSFRTSMFLETSAIYCVNDERMARGPANCAPWACQLFNRLEFEIQIVYVHRSNQRLLEDFAITIFI